jgi:hypothetical protein
VRADRGHHYETVSAQVATVRPALIDIRISRDQIVERYRNELIEAVAAVNVACNLVGLRRDEALYEIEIAVAAFAAGLRECEP